MLGPNGHSTSLTPRGPGHLPRDVPQVDVGIATPRREPGSVCREAEARHGVLVAREGGRALAPGQVPEADGPVTAA